MAHHDHVAETTSTELSLQTLLGHASLDTTRRYLDATAERLREVVRGHPGKWPCGTISEGQSPDLHRAGEIGCKHDGPNPAIPAQQSPRPARSDALTASLRQHWEGCAPTWTRP
jgi:hypothetical protein